MDGADQPGPRRYSKRDPREFDQYQGGEQDTTIWRFLLELTGRLKRMPTLC
jgi:hypothetical protein